MGLLLAFATCGAITLARHAPELPATALATTGVIVAWPFVQDRFLLPLLPLVGMLSAAGADWTARCVAARWPRPRVWAVQLLPTFALAAVAVAIVRANLLALLAARGTLLSPLLARRGAEVATWVASNTRPGDRVMADVGGGIYLRTGRATSPAWPEEPAVGRSVFADTGRYHAARLVADRDDWLVVWRYTGPRLLAQLAPIRARCPALLTPVPPLPAPGDTLPNAYFRVSPDRRCLETFLAERGWAASRAAGASR